MAEGPKKTGVSYKTKDADYFKKRGLKRYAGVWSLWALGVGAVISGDFFGWNFGLDSGGFGGMLAATGIIAIMYICMCYSIAEMSPPSRTPAAPIPLPGRLWDLGAGSSPASPRTWNTS